MTCAAFVCAVCGSETVGPADTRICFGCLVDGDASDFPKPRTREELIAAAEHIRREHGSGPGYSVADLIIAELRKP